MVREVEVPLSSAAVVPAAPVALSLLVVQAGAQVRAGAPGLRAARALPVVPEQAAQAEQLALVGRAALAGPEVLEVLEEA